MKVGVIDHHFADYTVGFCSELQKRAQVGLALSDEGLRELTSNRRRKLDDLSRHTLFNPRTKWGELTSFIKLVVFFARFRPDIVIAHENGQFYSSALLAVLRLFCPVYLIVHDPAPHSGADATAARKRAGRIALERRLASVFVVHGAFCADLLQRQRPDGTIISIPHGPILFDDSVIEEPRGDGEFLLFGRMQHYKGIDILLEAFARIIPDHPHVRLRLAGRGPELDRLKPLIDDLGRAVIVDREFVSPEKLIAYINATQSGVVSAAFANGRTVIVTDAGAIGEFVRHDVNGILLEPGSVASLESALRHFLSDASVRQRLEDGVRATAPNTDWKIGADLIIDHAQSVRPQKTKG
jgi:glycosyltransferase involved in cell wall biosynthesis